MSDRWIPVSEQMPEDTETGRLRFKVLVCNINNGSMSIRTLSRQLAHHLVRMNDGTREWIYRWEWSRRVSDKEITHWMPLPELPSVAEQEKVDG